MAKFCSQCGTPLPENAKFCSKCGKKVYDAMEDVREPLKQHDHNEPPMETMVSSDIESDKQTQTVHSITDHPMNMGTTNTNMKMQGHDKTSAFDKDMFTTKMTSPVEAVKKEVQSTSSHAIGKGRSGILGVLVDKYFTYNGRLNRKRYFLRGLLIFIILIIDTPFLDAIPVLAVPIMFVLTISSIMLGIRRCHDVNKSGWFYLLVFVPIVNIIASLYLLFAPGTTGSNTYGPDPLADN